MRTLSLAALALALVFAGSPGSARDRALVVGVNLYPGITVQGRGGARNLHGAVFDAQTFRKVLIEDFGFDPADVKLLTDGEATRSAILDAFRSWLIDGTKPGDQAVFFFAGHGLNAVVTDPSGEKRLTSGIVPADASGELAAETPSIRGPIFGPEVNGLLAGLAGRRVTVFADSCQSGSVTRDLGGAGGDGDLAGVRTLTPHAPADIDARDLTDALSLQAKTETRLIGTSPADAPTPQEGAGRQVVWHAATLAQVTFDYPGRPGGVFTQSFADGLHGKAAIPGRGIVTASSLRDYVQAEASRICKDIGPKCSDGLTPGVDAPSDYFGSVLAPRGPSPVPADAGEAVAFETDAALAHSNDFGLDVAILPGPALKTGQQLRFRIRAAEAGHLALFDAGPDGRITQIFPNRKSQATHKDGAIRADAPITIPDASYGFAFKATDRGRGSLIAVVAEDAADLPSIIKASNGLGTVSDRLLGITAAKLQAPVLSPTPGVPNRAARWSVVRVPYSVD